MSSQDKNTCLEIKEDKLNKQEDKGHIVLKLRIHQKNSKGHQRKTDFNKFIKIKKTNNTQRTQ